MVTPLLIGTAGWGIPKAHAPLFPPQGSHLERYAAVFPAVEVNSSFYRRHRRSTWERWGATVPPVFRFSVKMPRAITHERRLADAEPPLDEFLADVTGLGDRLGCLLVQLPPSLAFDPAIADRYFRAFRERYDGGLAAEPRHGSWFTSEAEVLLDAHRVSRVAADPACAESAGNPGGWMGSAYFRLHGAPRMYYSGYDADYLASLALRLGATRRRPAMSGAVWCIFDNTALGAATGNAGELLRSTR